MDVSVKLPTSGSQGEGDSRERSKGDQRDGQAEHRQRAAHVADGRQRHLVAACELWEQRGVGASPRAQSPGRPRSEGVLAPPQASRCPGSLQWRPLAAQLPLSPPRVSCGTSCPAGTSRLGWAARRGEEQGPGARRPGSKPSSAVSQWTPWDRAGAGLWL